MNQTAEHLLPWYRQVWFWLVIGPLLFIIVLCGITVSMAFHYSDDVVADNYYKEGRAINQVLLQDEQALALGLTANIRFDLATNEVLVSVTNNKNLPQQLLLFMDHPVKKDRDQHIVLREIVAGEYRGELPLRLEYFWYLSLVPEIDASKRTQAKWLLSGGIDFSKNAEALLQPRIK
ncbi:MAG: FixH family protein [Pseudomonadota bacterium]